MIRQVAVLTLLIVVPTLSAAEPAGYAQGCVVAVSPPAVEVGVETLKSGGNAVDAAVAVGLAMAVTWPSAGNIGGGGFMMIHPGGGREPTCIEYRETAPAATKADTFAREKDWYTHKVSGVPGTVRGFALAHARFGKLPWKDVVMPAVKLAEEGFAINDALASSLNVALAGSERFPELRRVYGHPQGGPWKAGEQLVLPDLGKTLRLIAEQGPDAFYTGPISDLIAAEMKAGGGFITKADLAAYQAKERKPIHGIFRGYDVYGPPPPSSGGIAMIQMLNVLETFDLKPRERWSPATIHLLAETMKRAFADRARHLGDADFVAIPEHLTTKAYARRVANSINPQQATPSAAVAPEIPLAPEGNDTTHYSVIDRDGMAVANTYTLERSYGSHVVVRGAGFLLNNEMIDFNWQPGVTDRTGRIGTPANQIAPGKRMLSSQTPTIVTQDGKVRLVTGSPGSRTIINTSTQVVLNVLAFEMSPAEAVAAPRIHHQWFPDELKIEMGPRTRPLVPALEKLGHTVRGGKQGDAHTIWVDPKTGRFIGAADRRIDGHAAGY